MRKKEKVDEYGNPVERSRLGSAFSLLMGLISAAIFLVVFVRMFQVRDSSVSKQLILDQPAYRLYCASLLQLKLPEAGESVSYFCAPTHRRFRCFSVHPQKTMEPEGRIQVREVCYLESADRLLLTVRLNTKYYPAEEGLGYDFVLRLLDGQDGSSIYTDDSYRITDVRGDYTFLRLAFRVPELDGRSTVRLLMLPKDGDPKESAYLNLKIYGADVYSQETSPDGNQVLLISN